MAGGGGWDYDDTCPMTFSKKKGRMPKKTSSKQIYDKRKEETTMKR